MAVPSATSGVSGVRGPRPSRRRLWGLRAVLIFASLLPLLWGIGSLVDAFGGGPHLVHYLIGAGVLLAALWLAPLAAMWRPERLPVALVAYLAFVVAAVTAAALSASNGVLAVVLIVQAGLVVLLHPYRMAALRRPIALSPLLLPLALVSGAALARYAVSRAGLQAVGDEHAVMAHYFDQAWVALAIALFVLLAALREDARRLAARVGGGALVVFGAVSILLPTTTSSLGVGWGSAGVAGGLATIIVAELETRRTAAGSGGRIAAAG